jgi:hypothetical protein
LKKEITLFSNKVFNKCFKINYKLFFLMQKKYYIFIITVFKWKKFRRNYK